MDTVDGATPSEKLVAATVWVRTAEVEPEKFASPLYCAVTGSEPAASVLMEKLATAEAFSGPVPSEVVPSKNVTLPVGVEVLPEGPVTVAVKVTD